MANKNKLSQIEEENLFQILKKRFEKNHIGLWTENIWQSFVEKRLSHPEKFWSLYQMEVTGGEPDLLKIDTKTGELIFFDCAAESPKGRRSVCFDLEALTARKEHKPKNSALGMASEMGIELLSEDQYRELQQFGNVDAKTSSWIQTPADIRRRGGALFGDWRYGHVFIYHNGAESYYASRGFRGLLRV